MKKNKRNKSALTLIEMMIAILVSSIVVLGMGAVLADAQRGYNSMYNRINSPVVVDAYVAKAAFDAIVRKSDMTNVGYNSANTKTITVYYYSDANDYTILTPDRYATFTADLGDKELTLDVGNWDGTNKSLLSTTILANDIKDAYFAPNGACIYMMIEVDNGKENLIITCSSIRHNKPL